MIRSALEAIPFVTVRGVYFPESEQDEEKLLLLMRKFMWACRRATTILWNGVGNKEAYNGAYELVNDYIYAESAVKHSKLILKGAEITGGFPYRKQKKIYVISRGSKWERDGNRNIKLTGGGELFNVKVKYPFADKGKWINGTASFGKYNPVIEELVQLATQNLEGYAAKITFNHNFNIHVSVPTELYLKHTRISYANGFRNAGFDVNSGRCNMVVVEGLKIVHRDAAKFPQLTQHGYPKERGWNEATAEIDRLLRSAKGYSVGRIFLEDLFLIGGKRKVKGKTSKGRRKASKFMKRKLLTWLALRALKHGFEVYLVDPRNTSVAGEVLGRRLGLDRHTGSAYAVAVRGFNALEAHEHSPKVKQF